jgi:hypothetical protein
LSITQDGAFQTHAEMLLTDEQRSSPALIFAMLCHPQAVTSQAWLIAGATEANPLDATVAAEIVPRAIVWVRTF